LGKNVERYGLQFLEDEYFAAALTDIKKPVAVVFIETQTSRIAELVVGVEQFLRVVEIDSEQLDAVVTAVCHPDVAEAVDDECTRLIELVQFSAGRSAVAVRHLLALTVNETDTVRC